MEISSEDSTTKEDLVSSSAVAVAQQSCPVCDKLFASTDIENHVNKCLFLSSTQTAPKQQQTPNEKKRNFEIFGSKSSERSASKKAKLSVGRTVVIKATSDQSSAESVINLSDDQEDLDKAEKEILKSYEKVDSKPEKLDIPLAEKMRPNVIEEYVGQDHIILKNTVLRSALDAHDIPSMILWGPPGCGKTTLAHIIANRCKEKQNYRFVKVSATMVGINDVKEIVKKAKNDLGFKRKTILFMDEIHRFNKLQQDTFLPHVENGTIILIGATTENPSFSLNSALLSRCRVITLEKLDSESLCKILERALQFYQTLVLDGTGDAGEVEAKVKTLGFLPGKAIDKNSIMWLADMCDGDGRIALNTLQLTMQTLEEQNHGAEDNSGLRLISIEALKEGIKKSHLLYDRKGDQHFDCISALHKSIRASHDNAALYWCTRMMEGGEDPRYICRRLVRAASEDIGLADPQALQIAMAAYQSVQLIGMPESDCIIAQCAVYLARAPKSREVYSALGKCRQSIKNCKGPMPPVPLHLRNAPTKLMKEIGCGRGYNTLDKEESGLEYMPAGMEDENYFSE